MTTVGDEDGSYLLPNTCQRSAVKASIDQPCSSSNGGSTATVPASRATASATSASRPRAHSIRMRWRSRSARRAHPQQAADDGRIAGPGMRIDLEDDVVSAFAHPVDAAGGEFPAPFGKIIESGRAQADPPRHSGQ